MRLNTPRAWDRAITRIVTATIMRPRRSLPIQRKALNAIGGYWPLPKGIQQTQLILAARPAVQWAAKHNKAKKVILYLHGGVYCIGSPKSHRDLCSHLATYADRPVIALDYRLAPDHVFPAAIDDVIAAYLELLAQGYAAKDIIIAGDSAGGGLSLTCLQQLRDQAIELPAAAYLISPWVDLRNTAPSHPAMAALDPVLSTAYLSALRDHYLQGTPNTDARVSPLLGDVSGLCPVFIQVGSDEVLLDDSLSLARSLKAAGGEVNLEESDGLWHVFQITPSLFKDARIALEKAGEFIKQY